MSVLLFNTFAKYKKDLADFQIWKLKTDKVLYFSIIFM